MRVTQSVVIMFMLFFLSGCAGTIKYNVNKDVYRSYEKKSSRAIVDLFKDNRPTLEKTNEYQRKNDRYLHTGNKSFKPDVPRQIADMISKHLKSSGVFDEVQVEDLSDDLLYNAEELQAYNDAGYRYVILGDLDHFYGYQSGGSGASGFFGAVGVLVEAMANKKLVGGHVKYANVQVVDLEEFAIVWQGDIEYEFEDKVALYDGPIAYALRALKEANNKLSQKIDDVVK